MPIARFQMPDGRIAKFEVAEGTTPEQAQASFEQWQTQSGTSNSPPVSNPGAPGGGATPPARGLTERFLRGAGLVGQGLATGAAGTAGMLGDALNSGLNMALPAGHQLGMPSQALQRGLNNMGAPQAENGAERAVAGISNFVGGAMLDPLSRGMAKRFAPNVGQPRPPTPKEQTIMDARKAGYKLPPSQGHGGVTGALLEGLAGKERVAKDIEIGNQQVTNRIARSEAGVAPGAPLTNDALEAAKQASVDAGYTPLKQAGQMSNGRVYRQALDSIESRYGNANPSFPGAAHDDVQALVNAYRRRSFDAGDAVESVQNLRRDASGAYRSGNNALAGAQKGISKALEDSMELNLGNSDKLDAFRTARTSLAKQNAVQRALVEGGGDVNAINMGQQFQKDPTKFSGGLDTMGRFASNFGSYAGMPKSEVVVPTNHFTGYTGWGGIGALGALATGHPLIAAAAAAPMARLGLRKSLMSEGAQRMFVDPKLGPGLLEKMLTDPRILRGMPAGIQGLFSDDGTNQR